MMTIRLASAAIAAKPQVAMRRMKGQRSMRKILLEIRRKGLLFAAIWLEIRRVMRRLVWIFPFFVLLSCRSSQPTPSAASGEFKGTMRQMGESFSTLLPIVLDPVQFNDPGNQDIVDSQLTRLA